MFLFCFIIYLFIVREWVKLNRCFMVELANQEVIFLVDFITLGD
jgi:hypothetical protein